MHGQKPVDRLHAQQQHGVPAGGLSGTTSVICRHVQGLEVTCNTLCTVSLQGQAHRQALLDLVEQTDLVAMTMLLIGLQICI